MVYPGLNRIQFGNGDVSVMLTMAGTLNDPHAMLVFQNREPTEIGKIEDDADLSRTSKGEYNPRRDFAMIFSRPESIDCVISALQVARDLTFGDHNLVDTILKDRDILIE